MSAPRCDECYGDDLGVFVDGFLKVAHGELLDEGFTAAAAFLAAAAALVASRGRFRVTTACTFLNGHLHRLHDRIDDFIGIPRIQINTLRSLTIDIRSKDF